MLKNKLPPNMKSDFWNDLLDSIQEESSVAKNEILKKKNFYVINQMSYDRVIELSEILGIPVDVSVDDSISFIRDELKSAPFRVRWKSTSKLYKSFFKVIKYTGEFFVYYYNGASLIRDAEDLLREITGWNVLKPYTHKSKNNFTGFLRETINLDTGLLLDEGWNLDQSSTKRNTKHICLEIVLDKVFFGDDAGLAPSQVLAPSINLAPQSQIRYLINPKYFSYLRTNMNQSRRAVEVVHIGCQLTAITDNSRFYDSMGQVSTMPDLVLNAVTTDYFSALASIDDISYMEFGIGIVANLPSEVFGTGIQPTNLYEKIARVDILVEEKFENETHIGCCAQYIGNMINDFEIGLGDGTETNFSTTIPYAPIKKHNVVISYTHLGIERFLHDDGNGNFTSEYGLGTINYETGLVEINTDIFYKEDVKMGDGDDVEKTFSYTVSMTKRPLRENSILINYVQSGTSYVAVDDGVGNITGINCTGTVNYSTGLVSVTFVQAIPSETEVMLQYEYRKIMPPDIGTKILTEYYFVGDKVDITEACVRDKDHNLIAYATFPRVRFDSFYNHLAMNFILKKTNF